MARTGGVVLVAGGTLLVALRWVPVPARTLALAVQTAAPLAGPVLVVIGVVLLVGARAWRAALASVLPLALVGWLVWPTVHRTSVPAGEHDLTLLSSNLKLGEGDSDRVMQAVRERHVDVLVLVEVTPELMARFDAAGVGRLLPHRLGEPAPRAAGLVVLSRYPLTPLSYNTDGRADTPYATLHAPGGDLLLRGVHPSAPTSARLWRADLDRLATWAHGVDPSTPVVMAGDFNATYSHPDLRHVAEGLDDAARVTGAGWAPTWPTDLPLPPFAQIDHVLVRHVGVVAYGDLVVPGSDHKAIWARLRVGAG